MEPSGQLLTVQVGTPRRYSLASTAGERGSWESSFVREPRPVRDPIVIGRHKRDNVRSIGDPVSATSPAALVKGRATIRADAS